MSKKDITCAYEAHANLSIALTSSLENPIRSLLSLSRTSFNSLHRPRRHDSFSGTLIYRNLSLTFDEVSNSICSLQVCAISARFFPCTVLKSCSYSRARKRTGSFGEVINDLWNVVNLLANNVFKCRASERGSIKYR